MSLSVPSVAGAVALAVALYGPAAGEDPTTRGSKSEPISGSEPPPTWTESERVTPEGPAEAAPDVDPKNYKMALAGNVLIGVGVGAFILMATGFLVASGARDRLGYATVNNDPDEDAIAKYDRRLRVGTALGITGAVSAGVLIATGITLTSVGKARERKRREALTSHRVAPVLAPGVAGLSWTGRF